MVEAGGEKNHHKKSLKFKGSQQGGERGLTIKKGGVKERKRRQRRALNEPLRAAEVGGSHKG